MQPLRHFLFGSRVSAAPEKPLPPIIVELANNHVEIALKRHAAARRFVLRLSRDGGSFTLTMPKRQSLKAAMAFVDASKDWMEKTIAKRPAPVALADGASFMLRGLPYRVEATGRVRGSVECDDVQRLVRVPGATPHVARRLTDWLKLQAEADLAAASDRYAKAMGCKFKRLSVRDQKSRWGSCTSDGVLSYSWRLVMAPPLVLDYVAAHEVAHLREMNHGPRFWRLVLTHCRTAKDAKRWLKVHGNSLHRYG